VKYRVTHSTTYIYRELVPLCHNEIRLNPRETVGQTCNTSDLAISPLPAARRDRIDFFGNHVTWISIQEPHDRLEIKAISEVEVKAHPIPPAITGPSWEKVAQMLVESRDPALCAAREYTFDSPHVKIDPELDAYARPSFAPGRPLLQCALELTQRIFKEFKFDSRATTIGTPILEVLHNRRGVCQDFAHLQIGCFRTLGLAARYVSGYVLTYPREGERRLVGADASHAWVSAYIPDIGWVDFDPTNGNMPTDEHVTLGWARDYEDVSPVRGVLVGGHRHSMNYSVDVLPMDEPAEVKPAVPTNGKPLSAATAAPTEVTEASAG